MRVKPRLLTMTTWSGPTPLPGEFLKTVNGISAYMVLGVKLPSDDQKWACKIEVERRPAATLDADKDLIHCFRWNARKKRR